MTGSGLSRTRLQRSLAEEFQRQGWEYDLGLLGRIVDQVEELGRVDADKLAGLAPAAFLRRSRASRADLRSAIDRAIGGNVPDPRPAGSVAPQMSILFVAAGPMDEVQLRLAAEHRDVTARIRSSTRRDQVVVDELMAARKSDLLDALNRHRPTILHIAGHGGPTGVVLEDAAGMSSYLSIGQLAAVVGVADSLKLVVLNSCESSALASALLKHVDAAIGMTRSIGDEAAMSFAAQFYASLAEGIPLTRAFEQARLAIDLAGLPDDQTPALYVRTGVDGSSITFT